MNALLRGSTSSKSQPTTPPDGTIAHAAVPSRWLREMETSAGCRSRKTSGAPLAAGRISIDTNCFGARGRLKVVRRRLASRSSAPVASRLGVSEPSVPPELVVRHRSTTRHREARRRLAARANKSPSRRLQSNFCLILSQSCSICPLCLGETALDSVDEIRSERFRRKDVVQRANFHGAMHAMNAVELGRHFPELLRVYELGELIQFRANSPLLSARQLEPVPG